MKREAQVSHFLSDIVNVSGALSTLGVPHVLGNDEEGIRKSILKMSQGYLIPDGPMKGELLALPINKTQATVAAGHLEIVKGHRVPRLVLKRVGQL